jgi:hypothetical protein
MIAMIDLDINSMYAYQVNTSTLKLSAFTLVNSSPDSSGVMWYEIAVQVTSLQRWIESQPEDLWCEGAYKWSKFPKLIYLVHESLYTFITLRWE